MKPGLTFFKSKFRNLLSDSKFSEILRGSAWALSARIIATCLAMVTSIIVARFYGAEVVGIVAVMNSFLILATIFTILGTSTSILRLIPEHLVKYSPRSAFNVYRKTQSFVVIMSLFTGGVFFFFSDVMAEKVFHKPHFAFYLSLAAVIVLFKSLLRLNTQAVRCLKLIRTFAFMQILPSFSNLVVLALLTVLFYTKDNPVYAYLAGFFVTAVTGLLIMQYAFRRRIQPSDQVERISMRGILNISLPMLMTATMQFVIGQTGLIMLGIFRSDADVGYYSIAVRLAMLTAFILEAINTMAGPKFSEFFHGGKMEELFYVARKSTRLIFWTTAPVLLGLVILGKPILWVLYGKEFTVAYTALIFLTLGQFIGSISGSTALFMNMTGRQNALRNIILGAAIINILLNVMLTPSLGMVGSSLAAMTSIASWNIYTLVYIKLKYGQTIGYFPAGHVLFKKCFRNKETRIA